MRLIAQEFDRPLGVEAQQVTAIEDLGQQRFGARFARLGADGVHHFLIMCDQPVARGQQIAGALFGRELTPACPSPPSPCHRCLDIKS